MPVWRAWTGFGEKVTALGGGTMEEYGADDGGGRCCYPGDRTEPLPHSTGGKRATEVVDAIRGIDMDDPCRGSRSREVPRDRTRLEAE